MSVELFLGVVAAGWLFVLWLDKTGRLKAERHSILLIFKTERGRGFIERAAGHRRFWKVFGSAAVLIGIVGMALVVLALVLALYSTYYLKEPTEGAMFVIPGVTIPFWYGIIGLITVLVVHEFAHGILARSENIKIKNMGAILVTIIPIGAFVEPDEEELKAAARMPRMRVYAAGPFANILLAIFAVLPILFFYGSFFDGSTVQIGSVVKCSPADGVLEEGMVLEAIGGKPINGPQDYIDAVSQIKPSQELAVETDGGTFTFVTAEHPQIPGRGFIGIRPAHPFNPGAAEYVYSILYWVALLNQGIGLINLAPLHLGVAATDGHHLLKDMLEKLKIKNAEKATMAVSMMLLLVLAISLFGPSPTQAVGC